jgi:hypothetical protein
MFQKDGDGSMPPFILALLAPTIAGAFVNSRLWTWRKPLPVQIDARVSIGRTLTATVLRRHGFDGLIDLTAEMPRWAARNMPLAYVAVPQLDLIPPTLPQLQRAVAELERLHENGRNVLVCCALGYGRSVLCAAAWLALRHGLLDARAALDAVRAMQPRAVWGDDAVVILQQWIDHHVATRSS